MTTLRPPTPVLAVLLAVALVPRPGHAADDAPAPLDSADAAARAVLAANPALSALEAQVAALKHGVPQAGVWQDPMAAVEYSNMPVDAPWPGNHPMSGIQLKVQQTLPAPGKLAARTAVAESRVVSARDALAEKQDQLVGLVRDLYHRLALVRQLKAVTVEHLGLVKQFIAVVRTSYEVGRAHQHDLLRLQVLRDRLADDLNGFDDRDRQLTSLLVAAVHRPPGTEVQTPEVTRAPAPPAHLDPLLAGALKRRPLLRDLADRAHTAELAARRAEVEQRPDVTVWLGYRIRTPAGTDPGTDFVTAGASIPLPWFWNSRRWGEKAQANRAMARSLTDRRQAAVDALRGRLEADLARWRRATQKAKTYSDGLVPEARRTLDATFAAYRVGRADFASLYQAELELLDFERTIRTAESDAARAAVDVSTLTGAYAPQGAPR